MLKEWNKEPDENGDITLTIKNDDGARVSSFKGKTMEELADKMADSQAHANLEIKRANQEISRLRRPDRARQPLTVTPQTISPADKLRYSEDVTNPEKVVDVIEEIVTRRTGLSPNKIGAEFARMSQKEQDEITRREAVAFVEDNPDYYPVPQNRDQLFEELRANGWDLTRNNLALVFETLKDRDTLIPWPDDSQEQIEPEPIPAQYRPASPQPVYINGNGSASGQTTASPAPSPRPRSVSTGLRHQDANASAPPPTRKKQYTRADVENMSRAEYSEKLRTDPDFRRQVDAMGA